MTQFDYVGVTFAVILLVAAIDLIFSPLMFIYTLERLGWIIPIWMGITAALIAGIIALIELFFLLSFEGICPIGDIRK